MRTEDVSDSIQRALEKQRKLEEAAGSDDLAVVTAHARNQLALARAVIEAARNYRDKVDYTGGDGSSFFREEQDILDARLQAWADHVNGEET